MMTRATGSPWRMTRGARACPSPGRGRQSARRVDPSPGLGRPSRRPRARRRRASGRAPRARLPGSGAWPSLLGQPGNRFTGPPGPEHRPRHRDGDRSQGSGRHQEHQDVSGLGRILGGCAHHEHRVRRLRRGRSGNRGEDGGDRPRATGVAWASRHPPATATPPRAGPMSIHHALRRSWASGRSGCSRYVRCLAVGPAVLVEALGHAPRRARAWPARRGRTPRPATSVGGGRTPRRSGRRARGGREVARGTLDPTAAAVRTVAGPLSQPHPVAGQPGRAEGRVTGPTEPSRASDGDPGAGPRQTEACRQVSDLGAGRGGRVGRWADPGALLGTTTVSTPRAIALAGRRRTALTV